MFEWRRQRTSHGIFILVDEVLGDILHHELIGRLRHPSVHERGQVEGWLAIKDKLIMDELIGSLVICSAMSDWNKEDNETCAVPIPCVRIQYQWFKGQRMHRYL